jgi:NhaP-type Na+/H+ or K+/H+ antiporter
MYMKLGLLAIIALFYSLLSGRIERSRITGPMVFIFIGFLMGPLGLDWLKLNVANQDLRILVDLTLALVLFIDAANADLSVIRRSTLIPRRMLLVGLPGAIALGWIAGMLLFDGLGVYQAAILATMLAATDAALGKSVVTNKAVPAHIREGLNLESGLNDGLCVPVLFVFIALAEGAGVQTDSTMMAQRMVFQELGIGLGVGLVITALTAWLIQRSWSLGWITQIWLQLPVIMLSIICFSVAQTLHGSGYIAAFAGGLLFGYYAKESTHKLVLAAEGMAETMALLTWVVFGVSVIGQAYPFFSWQVVVYALLSLTVIRILPIFLALTGTGEKTDSKLFLGWFGPRGLASIVFAIIVLNTNLPEARLMAIVVICTVFLSVIFHGVTANPLATIMAARSAKSVGHIVNPKPLSPEAD